MKKPFGPSKLMSAWKKRTMSVSEISSMTTEKVLRAPVKVGIPYLWISDKLIQGGISLPKWKI